MYCFENVCHQKITKKKLCMKRLVTVLQFQILVDNKENQTRVGIAIKKTVNLKFAVNEISTPINYGFYFLWRTEATPIQTIELKYLHTDLFPSLELKKKNSSGTCVIILSILKNNLTSHLWKRLPTKKNPPGGGGV